MILILTESFIFGEDYKFKILFFTIVGLSLPILCLLVTNMMKKMKGRTMYVKISFLFFFLVVGILFQSWFRGSVVTNLTQEAIIPCILILISSISFMTAITINLSELKKKEKSLSFFNERLFYAIL